MPVADPACIEYAVIAPLLSTVAVPDPARTVMPMAVL
jgi:hypothetical protein